MSFLKQLWLKVVKCFKQDVVVAQDVAELPEVAKEAGEGKFN